MTNKLRSFGPGLEFFDAPATPSPLSPEPLQPDAAAVVAAKLARIFDANPAYNLWDARQHLRQSASYYREGWREDGGYGRPAATPVKIDKLDPAPPVEIQALKSPDGTSIAFSWENFLETHFAETVIKRGNGAALYHGTGTSFNWISDVDGEETFSVFSKDKEGRLSRAEAYTTFTVSGLRRK